MEIPTFFTAEMDNSLFFSTIATTSTVFILVMTTFAIYRISTINENKRNKRREIYNYQLEISKLKLNNERNQKIINKFESKGNKLTPQELKEYRQCAEAIMANNLLIDTKEQIIEENNKFINRFKNIKNYLDNSIRRLYFFTFIYIVIPLFLLTLPSDHGYLIYLNAIKLILLITMVVFILIIIEECKENLSFSDSPNSEKIWESS